MFMLILLPFRMIKNFRKKLTALRVKKKKKKEMWKKQTNKNTNKQIVQLICENINCWSRKQLIEEYISDVREGIFR